MEPMGVAMWEEGSAWRCSMSSRLPGGTERSPTIIIMILNTAVYYT